MNGLHDFNSSSNERLDLKNKTCTDSELKKCKSVARLLAGAQQFHVLHLYQKEGMHQHQAER